MNTEITIEEKEEYLKDLFAQLHENGYSRKQAQVLVDKKRQQFDEITEFRDKLTLMMIIPKRFITDMDKMKPYQKRQALWDMGMDTRKFSFKEDICCYTFGSGRECGEVIIGNERLDREYLKLRVGGQRVASVDALFFNDKDEMWAMYSNKK